MKQIEMAPVPDFRASPIHFAEKLRADIASATGISYEELVAEYSQVRRDHLFSMQAWQRSTSPS